MNINSQISGTEIEEQDDKLISLSAFTKSQITSFPNGKFTEIDKNGQTQSLSYAEAYHYAQNIHSALREKGLRVEAEIVLCFDSVLDFIPSAWACTLAGYHWVPWSTSELDRNEKGFTSSFAALLEKLDEPWTISSGISYKLLDSNVINIDPNKLIDIDTLRNNTPGSTSDATIGEDLSEQGRSLVSTSGTTGQPKLACTPNHTLLNRLRAMLNRLSKAGEPIKYENTLQCYPLHSITGLGILFPNCQHIVYFSPSRLASHPQDLLLAIEQFGIQQVGLSSYMAAMLIDSIDRNKLSPDLSSVQRLSFGSDFIIPQIIIKIIKRFQYFGAKEFEVAFGYGMTEVGLICTSKYTTEYLLNLFKFNLHLPEIGKITKEVNLRIVDDNEQAVSDGQIGNVQIQSEQKMFDGYYGDEELTMNSFTSDGWFKTGDLGAVTEGKLTLTGREKTQLIINNKSITLDQIEVPLRSLSGLRQATVIAASIVTNHSLSQELAIFFAPETFDSSLLEELTNKITREVANNVNTSVKHLIPIETNDIERTSTGKIRRNQMVENYLHGKWKNLVQKSSENQKNDNALSRDYLPRLWKDILELNAAPPLDESFFHLGGDSLKAARLIATVETKFNCQLPLTVFYKNPTITTLQEILKNPEYSQSNVSIEDKISTSIDSAYQKPNNEQLLHKIETYVGGWEGKRQFPGSLIVGRNTNGWKMPIFWVFSNDEQFQTLAIKLGKHQPLYGMRSCADIVAVKDYTADVLQIIADRYLWEILALPVESPRVLGGNCQGAIIALALAKLLKKIGRAPATLMLMEWSFSFGKYTAPVLFIHGKDSLTAEIYTNPHSAKINWQQDFPNHKIVPISGGHGEYFDEPNIKMLIATLTKNSCPKTIWRSILDLVTKMRTRISRARRLV